MLQIAIISDIHGNLPALKAVLYDIEQRNIDQVFCLGDLVDFAPWPNEVINEIRHRNIPCLMGNHDERIAFDHPIIPLAKHGNEETQARVEAIEHTKKTISATNRSFLASLPRQIILKFVIGQQELRILLVHGSVRGNDEYIYEDHPASDICSMLEQEPADILVMGHTHLPYIRSLPQMVLNCGSVGRSKERLAYATYLSLKIDEQGCSPQIIRVSYDIKKTITAIKESDIPDFYANFLRNGMSEHFDKRG